jgi:peptidoglycan/LPS O-acetylase OafA/YrhL
MNGSPRTAPHYPFIDGLRGMAILGVLLVHSAQYFIEGARITSPATVAGQLLNAGTRGVQLFFIVSAFTLFSSSRVKFQNDRRPIFSFYMRRFFRIVPLWWLIVAIYAWTDGRAASECLSSFLLYFGFIRYRTNADIFPIGWSIFVEETFYILLPWIFARINGFRRASKFLVITWLLALVWSGAAKRAGIPDGNAFIFLFPLNHWFCFSLGICLFHLSENAQFKTLILGNRRYGRILDVLTVLALFKFIRQEYMTATVALVLLFIAAMSAHTLLGRLSRSKILGQFGICCYSIYLLHLLFLRWASPYQERCYLALGVGSAPWPFRFALWYATAALICLALGTLSYKLIERPCVQLGRKILDHLER